MAGRQCAKVRFGSPLAAARLQPRLPAIEYGGVNRRRAAGPDYGYRQPALWHRNAVLVFDAAAWPVRNKDDLRQFFEFITERLKRLYKIKID